MPDDLGIEPPIETTCNAMAGALRVASCYNIGNTLKETVTVILLRSPRLTVRFQPAANIHDFVLLRSLLIRERKNSVRSQTRINKINTYIHIFFIYFDIREKII